MAKVVVSFTGPSTVGPISVPGVRVGDRILSCVRFGGGQYVEMASDFVAFVVVKNEIIHNNTQDYSTYTFTALLDRDVVV